MYLVFFFVCVCSVRHGHTTPYPIATFSLTLSPVHSHENTGKRGAERRIIDGHRSARNPPHAIAQWSRNDTHTHTQCYICRVAQIDKFIRAPAAHAIHMPI